MSVPAIVEFHMRLPALILLVLTLFTAGSALAQDAPAAEEATSYGLAPAFDEHDAQSELPQHEPTRIAIDSPEDDALIQYLRKRSRRLRAGAITTDVVGGSIVVASLAALLDSDCGPLFGTGDYPTQILCEPSTDGEPRTLSLGGLAAVTAGSTFLASTLITAIPLHRAASAHRRAAQALEANEIDAANWNLDLHRGAQQRRIGRNYLIGAGAVAAIGLTSAIMIPATTNETRKETRTTMAAFTAIGAVGLAIPGIALNLHGRKLERRANTTNVTALVAPTFYADGGGVAIWMGF